MIPRNLLLGCFALFAMAASAQRSTDKTVKVTSWQYPKVATTQPTPYQVLIHNGSIPLETSTLIKRNGLRARLQKKQDDINNLTVDYYTYYPFTVTTTDPQLLIEISFGAYTKGSNQQKEHKIPCTIKGQKVTKETLLECPAYYYEYSYKLPYVIRLTDKAGNILHTEAFAGEGVQTFGLDATSMNGYLKKSELETAYANQLKSQPQFQASQAMALQLDQAEPMIQSYCFYSTFTKKIPVSSAAGKGFDYTALEAAQKQAIDAFDNYKKTSATAFLAKMAPFIKVWQQEVATLDMKSDNSRINRSIAAGLYTNLALAYAYAWQLDSAEANVARAQHLVKFAINLNAKEEVANIAMDIQTRKATFKTYQAQTAVTTEPVKAPELLDVIRVKQKELPYVAVTGKSKYDEWAAPIARKEENVVENALEQLFTKPTPASGGNSYEGKVQKTGFQGYILMLHAFVDGKMETLPEEICNITYLNELTVMNNTLKTIPENIGQLTELKKLNLSNNQLTSLPKGLQQCKKLKMLNLKGNAIPVKEVQELQAALPECKIKM